MEDKKEDLQLGGSHDSNGIRRGIQGMARTLYLPMDAVKCFDRLWLEDFILDTADQGWGGLHFCWIEQGMVNIRHTV